MFVYTVLAADTYRFSAGLMKSACNKALARIRLSNQSDLMITFLFVTRHAGY